MTEPLSTNMRAAVALQEVFVVAVVAALLVTVATVPPSAKFVAVAAVSPMVVMSLVFIRYCRRRKAWSFAGGALVGAAGVALRLIVSGQPSLEVNGGLPVGVTALYIVLGALVSLKSYESLLELRDAGRGLV